MVRGPLFCVTMEYKVGKPPCHGGSWRAIAKVKVSVYAKKGLGGLSCVAIWPTPVPWGSPPFFSFFPKRAAKTQFNHWAKAECWYFVFACPNFDWLIHLSYSSWSNQDYTIGPTERKHIFLEMRNIFLFNLEIFLVHSPDEWALRGYQDSLLETAQ